MNQKNWFPFLLILIVLKEMGRNRKNISKRIKEYVWNRQKGMCALCPDLAREIHHINPSVLLNGIDTSNNLIYLCHNHHKLLHLADPDTCMGIYEYAYYLTFKTLPDDPYSLMTAEKVIEALRS